MKIKKGSGIKRKYCKKYLLNMAGLLPDLNKNEDCMLMAGVAYHVLCKSDDLLDDINIRTYENKKTIKANLPSNIFSSASISDIFDQVYIGHIKIRCIPDERNIKKSFISRKNQLIIHKSRKPIKI